MSPLYQSNNTDNHTSRVIRAGYIFLFIQKILHLMPQVGFDPLSAEDQYYYWTL